MEEKEGQNPPDESKRLVKARSELDDYMAQVDQSMRQHEQLQGGGPEIRSRFSGRSSRAANFGIGMSKSLEKVRIEARSTTRKTLTARRRRRRKRSGNRGQEAARRGGAQS